MSCQRYAQPAPAAHKKAPVQVSGGAGANLELSADECRRSADAVKPTAAHVGRHEFNLSQQNKNLSQEGDPG
jgi:hypothetical protein